MSVLQAAVQNEPYSHEYFYLDYVCRICWQENAVKELTSLSFKDENRTLTIAEKIQECIGIDVSVNKYPEKICEDCVSKIEEYSVFRQKCMENEEKLSKILQGMPVVLEINELCTKEIQKKEVDEGPLETNSYNDCNQEIDTTDYEISQFDEYNTVNKYNQIESIDYKSSQLDEEENNGQIDTDNSSGNKKLKKVVKKRGVKKKTPTYCLICHTDYNSKENLINHNLEIHGDSNGVFKCFGCGKGFSIRNRRLKHERYMCKELKYGYKCDVCLISLPTRTVWEQHFRAHKKGEAIELPPDLFSCKKCSKRFDCMEMLVEHRKNHVKNVKQWVCDECGRAFTRRDYFNKHMMSHTGTKLHKCAHCGFTCVQKATLNVHVRRHTGERPFACDICPQRCTTSSNLREHKKRHLGIKSHECKVCNKKFGYKDSLGEHIASVHNRTESHTCDHCSAAYTHFRGLRRHMLQKHGKKITKKEFVYGEKAPEKVFSE